MQCLEVQFTSTQNFCNITVKFSNGREEGKQKQEDIGMKQEGRKEEG
jgi:hypothetical protein